MMGTYGELQFMDTMCNGEFLQKSPNEAFESLDELAEKVYTWSGPYLLKQTL